MFSERLMQRDWLMASHSESYVSSPVKQTFQK